MSKILVITNIVDPHSDSVINCIRKKSSVFRLNTDEILNQFGYEFEVDNELVHSNLKNPISRHLNLKDVSCIYYRRPEKPDFYGSNPMSKVSAEEAWHGLFHVLYSIYDKPWLGHPHRDKFASSRVVQLETAQKVGWKIPPTIISKDPRTIRKFALKHKTIAIKPLGEKGTSLHGQWFPYFTSKISAEQIIDKSDAEISATYNYLQSYIPKKNEWRITVIGDRVFPCIIHSQELEESATDWRKVNFESIKHEKGKITDNFKHKLIQYLKCLKLPFGAFDFILTPENEFVFLECNPNGQWLWIEELTSLPISKAIAQWLEKKRDEILY